jgi:DNA end-binding protein Ku
MPPHSLWSGNLRLSLVLVPVTLHSAASTDERVAFRMIHEPSGQPVRYQKGVRDGDTFTEVPDEEIVKGYEHAKGHHVLIKQDELDELKLEASHTIDMTTFVDRDEIDPRYFEKPYYLMPDGDSADEGYVVLNKALAKTGKVAIGQMVMGGREHIVGIMAYDKGLMLSILRYAHEVRDAEPYFEKITASPSTETVELARELIESQAGNFEPKKMPDEYSRAVRALVKRKVDKRAPEVQIETKAAAPAKVINIMAALKESMQKQGRTKVRESINRRMKNGAAKAKGGPKRQPRSTPLRTTH